MLKNIFIALLLIPIIAAAALLVTGNGYILTGVSRTYLQGEITANINDHTAFETHTIKTATPTPLPIDSEQLQNALSDDVREHLEAWGTAAYLVVQDGIVISEHYMNGYDTRSKTNSFSMAKTVVTLMIGIAIEEGYIQNLDQKLTDFLPEFNDDPLGSDATIGQLSTMTSGYEWVEHYYSPFSPTVELLYGQDVEDFLLNGHFSAQPGTFFEYSSASTQLLGIVLKRALEKQGITQTLSEYLSEKIWQPLAMNDDALWHTDGEGMELVYCCISSNARNFAKLGLLMLQQGKWNDQQIVSSDFIEKITTPTGAPHYGYSTWLSNNSQPNYYWFSGHLGQYIIVIPEHKLVVVRLGESRDTKSNFRRSEVPMLIEEALRLSEL